MRRYDAALGSSQGDIRCRRSRALVRIGAVLAVVCLLAPRAAEARADQPRRVLIVNSYHKEFQWTDAQSAGAREVLTAAFADLELYVEYLDTKRIAYEGEYLDLLGRTLRLKYQDVKLDAIIATDDNALRMVMTLHEDVFGGAPVAFCGINDYQPSLLAGRGQFTGLVEVLDIKPTIDLALRLHPGTRKVVVVVDNTPTGMGQRRDVAAVAARYQDLHFEYLKGEDLTHAELLAKLAGLDSDSIVLLTVWLRDKTGAYLAPETEGPRISEHSAVPVYGIIDMYLGHGIVGGKVLNSRTHGRTAAEMVVRILRGEKPADIPVLIESVNPYMFDARQLERWGVDEGDLPEESIVVHRPFSFYREYKALIWQVVAAFLVLLSIVLILAANVMRRRRAEKELHQYEHIVSSTTDMLALLDRDYVYLAANAAYLQAFAKTSDEVIGRTVAEVFGEEFFSAVIRPKAQRCLAGENIRYQDWFDFPVAGRKYMDVAYCPFPGLSTEVRGFVVTARDVTERMRMEEALREKAHIIRAAPSMIATADLEGKMTSVNPAFLQAWGFDDAEEVLGRPFPEFWMVEERIDEIMEALLRGERRWSDEIQARRKDGTFFDVQVFAATVHDAQDRPIALMSASVDITERKRAEAAMLRESLLSEEYINSLPGLFYVFDERRFVRWNSEWNRATGYSDEELAGKYGTDFFEGEDRTLIRERMLNVFREGVADAEADLVTKDGRRIPYYFTGVRKTFNGRDHLVGLGMDITDRRRAQEELRKSEERFRRFAVASSCGFAMGELSGQLIFANAATLRIVEEDSEEAFTHNTFYQYYTPEHAERLRQEILPIVLAEGQWVGEVPLLSARGNPIATEQNIFLIRDEKGTPRMVGNIITDITARKRAEEEKRTLERQVLHAQKLESLGVLAGGIAHDFNNLLMVILGNADLAMDDLSPHAPARENIQEILKASKRAAELAKQMLAYSGKGRFVVEPIDLGEFVGEMAHLLEVSISKKALLKYNFADNLPTFDGDATQIRQIIMNLITNASEAIGDTSGVIALSTGAIDCDRAYLDSVSEILRAGLDKPLGEGVYVYIEVADTGCGMDAETIEKVFDPFFTTKFTGRGLGMAAVLGIVHGHGGAIKIYSEVGKGTTFKILFPANESSDSGVAIQKRDMVQSEAWRGQGTVLIADDEETVCAVGRQMLTRMGFSVLTAVDGREAVEVFGEHADEIVCILLDLTMPRMDGEEAFRELRRIRPDVAVILCSGYNEQDATQRFAGKGLAGFVQKPYTMASLRAKLMDVLPEDPA